ncbi:MAG: hypothetical protein ACRD3L_13180 [Terriglobales bacterium]
MAFFVFVLSQPRQLSTQAPSSSKAPSLAQFFQVLLQDYDPSHLPKFEAFLKVQSQISDLRREDVASALPSVLARAFAHRDDTVRKYAAGAIFSIGQRPDGPALLRPHAEAIDDGLKASDAHLQGATVQLLAIFQPDLPEGVVSSLAAFVRRTDRDLSAQIDAITLMLRTEPNNPDVISAFQSFTSRPLDSQSKTALMSGISNSHADSTTATDVLVSGLEDREQSVRFQAAQALARMPKKAILRAQPALQRVIDDAEEAAEVKAAARQALLAIAPPH